MERIPEPELMDGEQQVQAYASADFAAADQAFVERLPPGCGAQPGALLVDLGCGPGNISFRLARRWPAARVVGLDGAGRMLAVARQRLAAEPALAGRLRFLEARLPLAAPGALAGACAAVVSNSLLHHLHDPAVLWQTTLALAGPGAWVALQDLRRPATPAALDALVEREMAAAPAVLRHDFRASLQAAFTPEEVAAQLAAAGLSGLSVAPLGDRHLAVWGRLP